MSRSVGDRSSSNYASIRHGRSLTTLAGAAAAAPEATLQRSSAARSRLDLGEECDRSSRGHDKHHPKIRHPTRRDHGAEPSRSRTFEESVLAGSVGREVATAPVLKTPQTVLTHLSAFPFLHRTTHTFSPWVTDQPTVSHGQTIAPYGAPEGRPPRSEPNG